jgi:2-dehydro-3-deoxyphosphogalactonate aldolase
MQARSQWQALNRKLIAILRGIHPEETGSIVECLIDSGFEAIEIPLNSPEPFRSIEIAAATAQRHAPGKCLIGAGTVLTPAEVDEVANSGGKLIVSPTIDQTVIARSKSLDLVSAPGVFTATEAHAGLAAGATVLKFFPASVLGPSGIKAIGAILPKDAEICAVGGISPPAFRDFRAVGVNAFGMASDLYAPGSSPKEISEKAKQIIIAYDRAAKN